MHIAHRRLPIGAELVEIDGERGAHFVVWAPDWQKVTLVLEQRRITMSRDSKGYFSTFAPGVAAGAKYRYQLGDDARLHADPASRFQPEGPFGPSEIVDPNDFAWTDQAWRGIDPHRHVFYEMHIGTFTPEGTYAAAANELAFLAELGITTIELMPVADFAGGYGWGYDGVNPFAPTRLYGTPNDLRAFIDKAHALGIAVILDVVYNHLGPSGNSFFVLAQNYRARADIPGNEWGESLNFDGEDAAAVREFFIANAGYWIDEMHFDGLRLDATQAIHDRSDEHVLTAIVRRARAAGGVRQIFVVAENEPQDVRQLRATHDQGYGIDALWNDDFHHAARVAATGIIDGYLHDYHGTPQELISAVKRGFLYQGQMYPWQRNPRGTPTRGFAPSRFVHFLTNHDQEANVSRGRRLVTQTSPARLRALTALLLLSPSLPLIFAGQETGTRRPWCFFADHDEDINRAVTKGRAQFMSQFSRFDAASSMREHLPDPVAAATFEACRLDPSERDLNAPWVRLHRDLLRLRRDDSAFTDRATAIDGAVLAPHAFVLRWFDPADAAKDRILIVNLGSALELESCAEPLIAPPVGASWRLQWSSEDPRYDGNGQPPPYTRAGLRLGGDTAVLLVPDAEATLRLDPSPVDRQTKLRFEP